MKILKWIFVITIMFLFLGVMTFSFVQAEKVDEIFFDRGIQKYLKGDVDGFIVDLEKALEFNPDYKKAKTFLVKVLVEKGSQLYLEKQFEKALPLLEEANGFLPDNEELKQMYNLTKQELFPIPIRKTTVIAGTVGVSSSGGTQVVPVVKDMDKENLMITLFDAFQRQQSKLIDAYVVPQQRLREQIEKSSRERRELLFAQSEERKNLFEMLEKKDKTVVNTFKSQKKEMKYTFVFGVVGGVLAIGVIIFVMYFILHSISARRESILMQHQEKMLALLGDERRKVDAFLDSSSYNLLNGSEKENFDIRTMMEHPNSHVRAKGVEVLEAQLIGDNQDSETAEQLLAPFLDDNNNRVKANAIKALYRYNRERSVKMIEEMVLSEDKWSRMSGVWVMGEVEDLEGISLLLNVVSTEKEEKVKKRILRTLKKIKENKKGKIGEELLVKINIVFDDD